MIYLNNREINITKFPDGTSQVWKLAEMPTGDVKIDWYYSNDAELLQILQLVDLLGFIDPGRHVDLFIAYLPYARQDKKISNETSFALYQFCNALLSTDFLHDIEILDPHSIRSLLNTGCTWLNVDLSAVNDYTFGTNLVAPDKGAAERLEGYDIVLDKVRDQLTGRIVSIDGIPSNLDGKYTIVDDICDGGATFIEIAKAMNVPKERLNLFVTHGIFSAGLDRLMDYFGTITCTASTMGFASSVLMDGLRRYPDRFTVLFDYKEFYH